MVIKRIIDIGEANLIEDISEECQGYEFTKDEELPYIEIIYPGITYSCCLSDTKELQIDKHNDGNYIIYREADWL